jgi:hypothetical protein
VGRRGGNLLVQIISTCRHGLRGRREGVGTLWGEYVQIQQTVKKFLKLLVICSEEKI